jgi:hypothetical protein
MRPVVKPSGLVGTDDDAKVLSDLGYKQVRCWHHGWRAARASAVCDCHLRSFNSHVHKELFRGFSGLNSFTFCFTAVNIVSSLCGLYGYGLITGGPVVMIW